jgi:hypothetical protein
LTAAGVLAIVYGSLFTLCSVCGLLGLAAQGAGQNLFGGRDPQQEKLQKQLQDAMEREIPGYRAVQVLGVALGLTQGIAFLIAGIGLIGIRSWARTLALVAGLVAIAWSIFQAVYQSAFVIPVMNHALQVELPAAIPAKAGPQGAGVVAVLQTFMTAVAVASVIFYVVVIIYLLIILLLLRRRHVRAAFASGRLPAQPEEAFRRDEDDEGWSGSRPPEDPEDDWRYR